MQPSDDLRDEDIVSEIRVVILRSGAMGVTGAIGNELHAVACLEQAVQSVKDHHRRLRGQASPLIVPAYDTPLRA